MSRIAYVNGQYRPHQEAAVHIEDRGFQFADGVYEGIEIRNGGLVDERRHLDRLERSLSELRMDMPMARKPLEFVLHETVRRNRVRYGFLYLQVTRGAARRDHGFPAQASPTLVVTARSSDLAKSDRLAAHGVGVITVPDNRWDRVDIKTIGLLPNVLAKQAARDAHCFEAWFVDEHGFVTEGASTNAWIVTQQGELVTRPADHGILRGITRTVLMEVAQNHQIRIVERPFTLAEAAQAKEAFITAASTVVMPVVRLDGKTIGNGAPGPVSMLLRNHFHQIAEFSGIFADAK